MSLHVVLGATGGTGSAVVRELVDRGHRVRAVNRGGDADVPEGVERLAADVSTAEGAKTAAAGADVVYHCAQPAYTRWPEEFPAMNERVLDGAAATGAKVVFADNLYMYGPIPGPLTEDTPQRATGRKGRTRIAMAARLLEAHRSGRVRTTMGRSSDYYGPRGVDSGAGELLFKPLLAGRTVRWLGSLDAPHTLSYLPDMARALVTLGERDEADGQAWHLPAAEPLTGRRFLELASAAAGQRPRIGTLSRAALRTAGLFRPAVREVLETAYQFERPFVVDAGRYQAAFGPFAPTPHAEALAATVDWFRQHLGAAR